MDPQPGCELCAPPRGVLVHEAAAWRVIRVDDAAYPAYYRLIWRDHVTAFSALAGEARAASMEAIAAIDGTLREVLRPDRVNIASLGNVVPHLHWHVIARHVWDEHFPQPIWGERQRAVPFDPVTRLPVSLADLDARVRAALTTAGSHHG